MSFGNNTFAFLSLPLLFLWTGSSDPIVKTPLGSVRGSHLLTRNGRTVEAFYNIPFAEPPVGELRLQPPLPAKPWNDIRDGTEPGPLCLQLYQSKVIGNEDCLYLNVYRPKRTNTDKLLPVMIYLSAGYFQNARTGNDTSGPQYFLDYDMILVVPNYRLSWLGLSSLEDRIIPGNWALKDQLQSMKWVRDNIKNFGGNPNRVTLSGYSSGGISSTVHLISPMSKGLFHQVIAQSGSILDFSALSHPGQVKNITMEFISTVGCNKSDSSIEILACLQRLPAESFILNNTIKIITRHPPRTRMLVIEPKDAPGAILTDNPYDLFRQMKPSNISLLVGMATNEGALFSERDFTNNRTFIEYCQKHYEECFPILLGYFYTSPLEKHDEISDKIFQFYFGNRTNGSSFDRWTDLHTDRQWLQPMRDQMKLYDGPKYMFYYDYLNNAYSFSKQYGDQKLNGPVHQDPLISQFYLSELIPQGLNGTDKRVSMEFVKLIANYVIRGTPNEEGKEIWKPVTTKNDEYLHISKNGSAYMSDNLRQDAYRLFSNLGLNQSY